MAEVKEEKKEEGRIGSLFNLMDRFTGDKVILLIALFLMLVSVVSVFSSTPLLARELGTGRMDIMLDQLKAVAMGFIFIFLLYFFGRVEIYRRLSMLGFAVTFGILIILVLNLNLGIVKAGSINGARRILMVAGKQIHVYEFVKVFMIMYLGWALDTFKRHGFTFLPWLAWKYPKRLGFLEKDFYQKLFYIYLPILLTTFMVMMGSNSSALFIGLIMVLMILVGGIDGKDIGIMVLALIVGVGSMFLAWKAGLLKDSRIGTAISRITQDDDAVMQKLLDAPRGSKDFNDARDELKQPVSALLAIKEGGVFGKGIGNSTQKYATPVIFGPPCQGHPGCKGVRQILRQDDRDGTHHPCHGPGLHAHGGERAPAVCAPDRPDSPPGESRNKLPAGVQHRLWHTAVHLQGCKGKYCKA